MFSGKEMGTGNKKITVDFNFFKYAENVLGEKCTPFFFLNIVTCLAVYYDMAVIL